MKNLKKFLCSLLVLTVLLGISSSNVLAQDNSQQVISEAEYATAMNNLCVKYGGAYEYYGKADGVVLTKALLAKDLSTLKANLDKSAKKNTVTIEDKVNVLGIMPYTDTQTQFFRLSSPTGLGSAGFGLSLVTTKDANKGVYVAVQSCSCYQQGAYLNIKSWDLLGQSATINSNGKVCTVALYIRMTLEISASGTSGGYVSYHNVNLNFNA